MIRSHMLTLSNSTHWCTCSQVLDLLDSIWKTSPIGRQTLGFDPGPSCLTCPWVKNLSSLLIFVARKALEAYGTMCAQISQIAVL